MQSTGATSIVQRFENYQPSKTIVVWARIAAAAATMIVGFNWGGWVTGGTSRMVATSASDVAKGELASAICVQRFNAAPQATAKLVELKALGDGYKQRQFVEAEGWATMPGQTSPDRSVVGRRSPMPLCA